MLISQKHEVQTKLIITSSNTCTFIFFFLKYGADLSPEQQEVISEDQSEQLSKLKEEITAEVAGSLEVEVHKSK